MASLLLGNKSLEYQSPPAVLDTSEALPTWLLGASGTGKSTALEGMAGQLLATEGVTFLDPHGSSVENLLWLVPKSRTDAVIYLNPADPTGHIVGFNPLAEVRPAYREKVASQMVSVFAAQWGASFQSRAQGLLKMALSALLTFPGANFLHIEKLLTERSFRERVTPGISDGLVKKFWAVTFPSWNPRYRDDAVEPILNKIRPTLSPQMQAVLCQQSKVDMRAVIENRHILLCDLSSGELGEAESSILGALLFGKLFWTAMSLKRKNPMHYVFYDEAEATNALMAAALSQARKHFLVLTLANQYASQYEKAVLDSLSANASNKIVFRVSADDAEKLAREFPANVQERHLTDLNSFEAYVKSITRGKTTAYKIQTLPPFGATYSPLKARILRESRARYGTPQSTIDAHLRRALSSQHAPHPRMVNHRGHPPHLRRGRPPGGSSPVRTNYL